jgi:hypothetical protein
MVDNEEKVANNLKLYLYKDILKLKDSSTFVLRIKLK